MQNFYIYFFTIFVYFEFKYPLSFLLHGMIFMLVFLHEQNCLNAYNQFLTSYINKGLQQLGIFHFSLESLVMGRVCLAAGSPCFYILIHSMSSC